MLRANQTRSWIFGGVSPEGQSQNPRSAKAALRYWDALSHHVHGECTNETCQKQDLPRPLGATRPGHRRNRRRCQQGQRLASGARPFTMSFLPALLYLCDNGECHPYDQRFLFSWCVCVRGASVHVSDTISPSSRHMEASRSLQRHLTLFCVPLPFFSFDFTEASLFRKFWGGPEQDGHLLSQMPSGFHGETGGILLWLLDFKGTGTLPPPKKKTRGPSQKHGKSQKTAPPARATGATFNRPTAGDRMGRLRGRPGGRSGGHQRQASRARLLRLRLIEPSFDWEFPQQIYIYMYVYIIQKKETKKNATHVFEVHHGTKYQKAKKTRPTKTKHEGTISN